MRVLLVEDDEGDAFLVRELLLDAGSDVDLLRARSIAEAAAHLVDSSVDCVLLDLGLPDASGLDALRSVLELAPNIAVLVLTGLSDEHRGTEAVAVGAQDYLVKGSIDGQLLTRAIRYAVERKRADESVGCTPRRRGQRRTRVSNAACCPSHCCATDPCTSLRTTGPDGTSRCWAATSTTSSSAPTATCSR
jgi:DNA-binding response OmpR family regulator